MTSRTFKVTMSVSFSSVYQTVSVSMASNKLIIVVLLGTVPHFNSTFDSRLSGGILSELSKRKKLPAVNKIPSFPAGIVFV